MPHRHDTSPPPMEAAVQAAACSTTTIDGVFRRAFTVFADRVAVTSESGSWTYAELRARSWRLANALASLGLKRGGRIAVLCETRPEYIETYAACAALGVTVVALNIRLHPEELLHCLEKTVPSVVISSGALAVAIAPLRDRAPFLKHWIALDGSEREGWFGYEPLLAAAAPDEPPVVAGPEDIHNVLFTSGTTGRPKGAMISQRAAAIRGLRLAQWFGLTGADGFIGWLPLFHCGGDESLYATLIAGGVFATFAKADVETMFRAIERHRLSWTLLLPGVLTDFLNHPRRGDYDLSSFRFAIGYANMMPDIVAQLTATFKIDFYDAFGQSEVSYLLAHGVCRPGEKPSLHKQPSPLLDLRIVDDAMNEMPVGKPGECVVRGPSVMSGYLDDPAANEEVFQGGWLHTGDLLRREPDGTLTYVDRKRYLIKSGGENVYPAEVEQVIARHPAVQEACVLGIPDAYWGETIKAVLVLRQNRQASAADIIAWCREHLASYKRPRFIEFVRPEQLPRSTTGKLQRHELATWPVTEAQKV
jgi:acyl-CoA synthetase (AMP-forming)/AMP-acid ligase II